MLVLEICDDQGLDKKGKTSFIFLLKESFFKGM